MVRTAAPLVSTGMGKDPERPKLIVPFRPFDFLFTSPEWRKLEGE